MTANVINLAAVRAARRAGPDWPKLPFDPALVLRPRSFSAEERAQITAAVWLCLAHSALLTEWEGNFLKSIAAWPYPLSDKQRHAIGRILDMRRG